MGTLFFFKYNILLQLVQKYYEAIYNNGLPKESNVECNSYFYFYSTTHLQQSFIFFKSSFWDHNTMRIMSFATKKCPLELVCNNAT